jgi:crotonobetainyl-CoA:carnitine CoA-transferase CaiB-like acyl-CoA transferase
MFDHPQVLAEEMIAPLAHRTLGSYRGVTRPIVFGRTPGPAPYAAPVFDQDTAAVMAAAVTDNDEGQLQ